ncbi:hypothetical protein HZY91_08280 [Facklamia sp. DSM 111018]|uniref:DUF4811 domain-containing protein n=1 Tax=Facklamia lactis TaxID=2749967 RepID=A0ABS0LSE3_9LACT|nr:hypothetical protein [Facklamia lactis]MBG9981081.1 hypothetical protein [Facklamia lactis]MBG9986882.1 hypothetical protein [Facklamia lactis]
MTIYRNTKKFRSTLSFLMRIGSIAIALLLLYFSISTSDGNPVIFILALLVGLAIIIAAIIFETQLAIKYRSVYVIDEDQILWRLFHQGGGNPDFAITKFGRIKKIYQQSQEVRKNAQNDQYSFDIVTTYKKDPHSKQIKDLIKAGTTITPMYEAKWMGESDNDFDIRYTDEKQKSKTYSIPKSYTELEQTLKAWSLPQQ